mmetsp:Transcript_51650/g.82045  ORF Transcript_51650/g.82045 Transcript_51650/m.82045 type:complete len:363 (-) Transcript_51650:1414-2502(-)
MQDGSLPKRRCMSSRTRPTALSRSSSLNELSSLSGERILTNVSASSISHECFMFNLDKASRKSDASTILSHAGVFSFFDASSSSLSLSSPSPSNATSKRATMLWKLSDEQCPRERSNPYALSFSSGICAKLVFTQVMSIGVICFLGVGVGDTFGKALVGLRLTPPADPVLLRSRFDDESGGKPSKFIFFPASDVMLTSRMLPAFFMSGMLPMLFLRPILFGAALSGTLPFKEDTLLLRNLAAACKLPLLSIFGFKMSTTAAMLLLLFGVFSCANARPSEPMLKLALLPPAPAPGREAAAEFLLAPFCRIRASTALESLRGWPWPKAGLCVTSGGSSDRSLNESSSSGFGGGSPSFSTHSASL